jgi:hypothetical protein
MLGFFEDNIYVVFGDQVFQQFIGITMDTNVHLIYPGELEIKDTTESDKSVSYLDILLNIDSNGRVTTSLYDKRDDFDFAIFNFPFLFSNIHFHLLMVCTSPSWFDTQEHVLRMETFQNVANLQKNVDVARL